MTRALIIGGGIAGPAAALALARAGVASEIFEQHPGPADEAGVFFTLGSNGVDALGAIGLREAAMDRGFATPAIELRSGTGKPLGVSRITTTREDGTPSQTMRRAELYGILRDRAVAAGIPITLGTKLVTAADTGEGVVATFDDGSTAHGDLLIGCDGVHSRTRTLIDPGAPRPVGAGLVNFGGYTSGVRVDTEPGTFRMIFGSRAFFGYATAPDGTVWWFANEPTSGSAPADLPSRDAAELRRHLGALFRDDAGPAAELIAAGHDLARPTLTHLLPHLPHWRRGRMVVIGDAAHAPSPSSGQGASLSIEDAIVLAQCVRDLGAVPAALTRFEAIRRPRVERIVASAARVNSSKAATGIARRVRDLVLPAILRFSGAHGIEDTYGHRIEWDRRIEA
ncbi:FAD-dependent monooxygenase [Leucobacter allii]|uniref:FAD-dependent monooxygenase n=1 Tax=Leucobacter allii TaxID=2932247 RepID=A0ABY4FNQ2_9MICO|nr:FAD-dependent monooxygenase [Leucobacter allii]UOQ57882.1 FAD-dependent monooxygenase [Leucobacter allii]